MALLGWLRILGVTVSSDYGIVGLRHIHIPQYIPQSIPRSEYHRNTFDIFKSFTLMSHGFFLPSPKLDSAGVRVKIKTTSLGYLNIG